MDRAPQTVEHRMVRNGDIDIAVYEHGNRSGETILLLHGWPDSHRLWDGVTPLLADRFHVVTVDNRGHGRSSNPRAVRDFRITELAADYLAVIDAVSPDEPVHVMAHDWGSVAMWEAVCDNAVQHRIASFTSVSGPSATHLTRWAADRLSRPTPKNLGLVAAQALSLAYMLYFRLPWLPRALFAATMNETRWRESLARAERIGPDAVFLGPTFEHDVGSGLRIYRANMPGAMNVADRFTRVPVQTIVGSRDPAVRRSGYADTLNWAPAAWHRTVEGGHWLPFSHPEMLATAATELIDLASGQPPARGLKRAEMGRRRKPFEDHLVVITGAGSGIGRATALAFARDGAEVVVSDTDAIVVKETAALIAECGGIAHAYCVDVADEDVVAAHAAQVAAVHGVPDVLINNAGVGQAGRFLDTPPADFRRVLDVNLYGVINGCRAFGPMMARRGLGGHIVNLSSMAAYTPQQGLSAYSTSKSAVFMFSDCLRAELASVGIGVSTICPGVVHTNIVRNSVVSGLSPEEAAKKVAAVDRAYRLRRYGADKVAERIINAVKEKRPVVPVTPEARIQYRLTRIAPGLARLAARTSLLG
ncbi:SDR family oxidoreductase [Mycobacterium syngnathidarum]